MNAPVKTETPNLPAKTELVASGGSPVAIIPKTVEDMFRLAAAFHKSGLAPRTLDTPEKVTIAIMGGAELGLAPFQAVQAFYVVNNRPTLWGDALPALLWANGFKIKEWYEGEGEELVAKCEVTRPDGTVVPGEFSMKDARDAKLLGKDGPWQTARRRMLKMRARAFTARDGAADVLKGFQIREEVEDYDVREPTPQTSGLAGRLAGQTQGPGFTPGHVARETAPGAAHQEPEPLDAEFEPLDESKPYAPEPDVPEVARDDTPPEPEVEVETPAEAERSDLPEGVMRGSELLAREQTEAEVETPADEEAAVEDQPLSEEAESFTKRLERDIDKAKSPDELETIWPKSAALRAHLADVAPGRLQAVQDRFNAKHEALS